jgi:hypothetical protein
MPRDWRRPVLHRADNGVDSSSDYGCYHAQHEEQHQNQNDFAAAEVQEGKSVWWSIHVAIWRPSNQSNWKPSTEKCQAESLVWVRLKLPVKNSQF